MGNALSPLQIAIVGPCGSGKTTLADSLREKGFLARQIAQEHSYVPDMWQVLTRPDLLIYLDASYETCTARKQLAWSPAEHAEQVRRLTHARDHCDAYLQTDDLTPTQVTTAVLNAIKIRLPPGAGV